MKNMNAIYICELAMLYFPDSSKRKASMQLRRLMKLNGSLQQKLAQSGFHPYQQAITPLQHEAIVEALGKP